MDKDQQHTFPKTERLKSRKIIGELFSKGHVVKSYPIRIHFMFLQSEQFPICQSGVSVPKRSFKKAVDRNRIKRQLREVHRLNSAVFLEQLRSSHKKIAFMIIYTGKEMPDYQSLTKNFINALEKIKL